LNAPCFPNVLAFCSTACLVEVMGFEVKSSGMTMIKADLAD